MARNVEFDIVANDRASRTLNHVGGSFDKAGGKLKGFGLAAGAAAVAVGGMALIVGKAAVEAASNLQETTSKIGVLFGKQATAIDKWSESSAKAFGQSKQQAMDAAATFATFGKSAGLSGTKLVGFSTDMTELASDMASFSNTSPEQAIEAIGAALRGESEPIRQYGVLLDDATLRQQALKLGLIKTTKDALTPQQKVLAAQAEILKQTGAAQGDFARTSGGLANQQRTLSAQFEDLKTKLGSAFLPTVTKVFNFLNDKGIPALEGIGKGIGVFFGAFKANDQSWNEFDGKLKAVNNAGLRAREIFDKVAGVFKQLAGWVRDDLLPAWREAYQKALPSLKTAFDMIKKALDDNKDGIGKVQALFKALGIIITEVIVPAVGLLARFIAFNLAVQFTMLAAIINKVVLPAIKLMVQVALWQFGLLIEGAAKLFGWVPGIGPKLRQAAKDFEAFKARVNAALSGIKDRKVQINANLALTYSGNSQVATLVSRTIAKGGQAKVRSIRMMAAGGPFTAGEQAIVGERGPELVQFGSSGRVIPNGQSVGGGGVTVHVHNAVVGNEREIARVVTDAIRTATARGQLRPA